MDITMTTPAGRNEEKEVIEQVTIPPKSSSNGEAEAGTGVEVNDDDQNNQEEDDDDDDSSSYSPACNYCSFAVTGPTATFQAIFVCHSCFNESTEQKTPLCICQACADHCHNAEHHDIDHDVEYIGMGPSYCDCDHVGNCSIYSKSQIEAERMGILSFINSSKESGQQQQQQQNQESKSENEDDDDCTRKESTETPQPEVEVNSNNKFHKYDVYNILDLQQDDEDNKNAIITNLLIDHAQELIKYSKETFWIDEKLVNNKNKSKNNGVNDEGQQLCLLEQFAWNIYQCHQRNYESLLKIQNNDENETTTITGEGGGGGGAEWWVQVKDIISTKKNGNSDGDGNGDTKSVAIDLHYDKDEALAEAFGIGSFPTLSTVTYLTSSSSKTTTTTTTTTTTESAAPTIVFDHIYEQGEDELINEMLISRPKIGKHLVFDGKLLHGAPSHELLMLSSQQQQQQTPQELQELSQPVPNNVGSSTNDGANNNNDNNIHSNIRVTFLVNIWKNRKPANVHFLDDDIRQKLLNLPIPPSITTHDNSIEENDASSPSSLFSFEDEFMTKQQQIPTFHLEKEEALPKDLQYRMQLPFVAKGVTWEEQLNLDDDDEDEDGGGSRGLVVVTFPPPPPSQSKGEIEDTLIVKFGPGLQAYLDYQQNDDEEEKKEATGINEEHESGYV